MRPHRLRITAFGPFAGTAEVDVDALGAAGLFLLHGETGAGKTTVLDAIGYALYGQVPGARMAARRLRSDHAAPDVRSEVQLELTIGGRRLEVTRWPEWERPKRRGTGTTTEKAGARLRERVGESWETVSTRVDEVSSELTDLLGMSAPQFFQVVLLPQGEFATFLRAPSDQRGALLEKLFDLGRFADVEGWLAARRRAAAAQVDEARERVGRVAARVAEAAEVDEPPEEPDLAWVDALCKAAESARASAEEWAERARLRARAAQETLDETVRTAERQRRRRDADRRATALAAQAPAHAERHHRLAAARRAAAVVPTLALVRDAEAAAAAAVETAATARTALPEAYAAAAPGVLRAHAGRCREEAGRLDDVAALEDGLPDRQEQAAVLATSREESTAAAAAARRERAALPARRAAVEVALESARAAQVSLPALQAEAEAATERVAVAQERDAVAARLLDAREEEVQARERYVAAAEHHSDLRARRIDGMAAELAARLEPDTPCPVCGSVEHPDLTEMAPDGVSDADERAAAAAAAQALTVSSAAQRRSGELRAEDARLRGLLGDEADVAVAVLADRAAAVTERCDETAARAAEVATLEEERSALDARRTAVDEQLTAAESHAGAAAARLEAVRAELDRDSAKVAEARAGAASVAARRGQLLAQAAACDEAADAAERARREEESLADARRRLADAAVAAGFDGVAAARAAACTEEEVRALEREVRAHEEEEAAVRELLADPDLRVPLDPPADVEAARQVVDGATGDVESAVVAERAAQARCLSLARLADDLAGRLADLAPLVAEHREVRALADLAAGAGQNQLKMRLSAFVLAARLEEVAEAASRRLERMTQGRYTLAHTDAGRGNARAGLGLLVRDAWTGRDRDTATLSGGETFMASLALALGLADVVTAESGGLRLDTLFVDEGFGSLDPESLEEVMDVLDGLRDGGRVVGLVSHVSELQQRIPTQLHVAKGRAGSAVRLVRG